ncbi:MAG: hypothetical protein WC838_04940 [Candidatus Margulisiibacteriota bacterium]|jgi:hypothetical protein
MYLFIIYITWSFGVVFNAPVGMNIKEAKIVSSPEAAAILVWENEKSKFGPEPDRHSYKLFKIDVESMKMEEVKIPKLTFEKEG